MTLIELQPPSKSKCVMGYGTSVKSESVLIKREKPWVITGQSRTLTVEICKYLVRSWLRLLYGIIKIYTVSDIVQVLNFLRPLLPSLITLWQVPLSYSISAFRNFWIKKTEINQEKSKPLYQADPERSSKVTIFNL